MNQSQNGIIIPNQSLFEEKFQSNWVGSLTFKEIDMISYGFREKIFQITWIRSTSIMHGLLIFDSNNNQIIVKGFANWSILVFSLIWLSVPISWLVRILSGERMLGVGLLGEGMLGEGMLFSLLIPLGAIAFFILVMGICYLIQFSRFSGVASYAAQLWARKHLRNGDEAEEGIQWTRKE